MVSIFAAISKRMGFPFVEKRWRMRCPFCKKCIFYRQEGRNIGRSWPTPRWIDYPKHIFTFFFLFIINLSTKKSTKDLYHQIQALFEENKKINKQELLKESRTVYMLEGRIGGYVRFVVAFLWFVHRIVPLSYINSVSVSVVDSSTMFMWHWKPHFIVLLLLK